MTTYEVLNMCDVLITDYSSVMYDFANSGKKIILFAYDIEDYAGSRGMYEDIRNYPFPLVRTPSGGGRAVCRRLSDQLDEALRQKYGTYEHGSGIKKLCHHVILGENCSATLHLLVGNQKKNVLLYAGDFQQNGITTSFLNLMKELDQGGIQLLYFLPYEFSEGSPLAPGLPAPAGQCVSPWKRDEHGCGHRHLPGTLHEVWNPHQTACPRLRKRVEKAFWKFQNFRRFFTLTATKIT